MTDERHRPRRHDLSEQPTEQLDLERLRYFTQPAEGKPSTRHRRRREGADGSQPTRRAARTPVPPPPPTTGPQPRAPRPMTPPDTVPPSGAQPAVAQPADAQPDARGRVPEPPRPTQRRPDADPTETVPHTRPKPERAVPKRIPPGGVDGDRPLAVSSGEYADPLRSAVPHRARRRPVQTPAHSPVPTEQVVATERSSVLDELEFDDHRDLDHRELELGDRGVLDSADDAADGTRRRRRQRTGRDRRRGAVRPRGGDTGAAPGRTRRRVVLGVVLVCMLALVVGVGFVGLRSFGVFENRKDYTNTAGTSDVIVDIPQNSTLMDFGRILEDNDVVGSVRAFVNAADGQAMSGGYYKLRTQIPAATAVQMMTDGNEYRVGRMVVPEGLQLDNKEGVDGKTTPGIFQMISNATAVTVNGQRVGADVGQLEKAAADATPDQLGVPEWARPTVEQLAGDHRRIDGLIAPGTWETIDPDHSPTQILHDLIVASALRFEQWGLLETHDSGLSPYQTLVAASVVEREVASPEDFPKVARVILNRLRDGQRLEMDSTANYTATVTNIDVYGDAYKADNKWNTYRITGLPVTPIGAVGERALTAVEHPTPGRWLYFVTIDRNGTTLFANTFDEHKQNREKACQNKLLTTGCS
ncbi:endolytic transglycosylase MltG [Gordonia sp. ABSL11-1]|uniref:endolytic transglycosylase MltG n=1 Tax=Gordonia sp. ABSL11-1 TaxID=3053924 RepID=UPI00257437E5|nr:endolytic transglycosylase MltG [Gordonia sp. ABSL11-1]MDL9947525.1 endolytic transglycosylase MltG [Gordonia sp. ABSL11-1]